MIRSIFLICLTVVSYLGRAQCPNSPIFLSTQQDIDNFALDYPDCTQLINVLEIEGPSITNLNGLTQLESSTISSRITIVNTGIENFTGLDNLQAVGSRIEILGNENLINFVGLEQLTSIHQNLFVAGNASLVSFEGLSGLTSVGGALRIENNPLLLDFSGMNSISILGIDGTQPVGNRGLEIDQNSSLVSFNGLENLTEINGAVIIEGNSSLESFIGLQNVVVIRSLVSINDNHSLTDMSGLDSLEVIEDSTLKVDRNDGLLSFEGLNALRIIGRNLDINENDSLNSIDALAGVEPNPFSSRLTISENPNLPFCSIEVICANISDQSLFIFIENNANGCNSVEQIEQGCLLNINEANIITLKIFPNPTQNVINFESYEEIDLIQIHDISGKLILESSTRTIDVSKMTSGIYIARILIDGRTEIKKFVKA
ncbi:MAG: T9SS type A sorting domain-containing protein [Bacteroidota bacterium]